MHRFRLLSQNNWCQATFTPYKPDTSLRQTVRAGPNNVHLSEALLGGLYVPRLSFKPFHITISKVCIPL